MANTFIFDDDEQPDMGGGMTPEQDDDQAPEEGEGGNRVFTMIMIGIGVFFVLALLCVGGFFLLNRNNAQASISATDTFATQQVLGTQTQQAIQASPTLASTLELSETPTTTPVVVVFASETPTSIDPDKATLAVQQTQLAQTQQAQQVLTTTATFEAKGTPGKAGAAGGGKPTPKIPQTGFADEVGLPALVIVTVVLLAVILLARRLRTAPER